MLDEVAAAFTSQAARVGNYAGALVEESQSTFAAGVLRASPPPGDPDEPFGQWVAVLDGATCVDCLEEGTAGFRPLGDFRRWPAGEVECGRHCRCVLGVWTRAEVESGEAEDLSGQ